MSRDNNSKHYDAGGIETLDIIKAKLTPEQYKGYLLGNVLKYSCRLNFKDDPARDAEKAANYAKWLKDYYCNVPLITGCGSCSCSECDRDYIEEIRVGGVGGVHHG